MFSYWCESLSEEDQVTNHSISSGYFCLAFCLGPSRTWEEDYDDMVLELLDEDESCFIIYRLDEARGKHFEHVLITWQPEDAPVSHLHILSPPQVSYHLALPGQPIGPMQQLFFNFVTNVPYSLILNCVLLHSAGR